MNKLLNKEFTYAIDLWDEEQVTEIFVFEPGDFNENESIIETIVSTLSQHTIETYLSDNRLSNDNMHYKITLNTISDDEENETPSSLNPDKHWIELNESLSRRFVETLCLSALN